MAPPFLPKDSDIRRKLLLRLGTSPLTLAPFLVGVTAMIGSWGFDARPDLGLLAGLAGVLCAGGMFLTQLVLRGEDEAREAIREVQGELRRAHEARLDALEKNLVRDGDPRTEAALRDLRALARALEESGGGADVANLVELHGDANELFQQCVRSLERSLTLWQTASALRTKSARQPILEQREGLLRDVFESIRHLGQLLASLESLGAGEGSAAELGRIRSELEQNLRVAKQVDARLREFDRNYTGQLSE